AFCHVLELETTATSLLGEAMDLAGQIEQRTLACALHHRDHETAVGRGCDADVVVAAGDDLLSGLVEGAVQHGVTAERKDDRLHDERKEREVDPALDRGGLEPLAKVFQRRDVTLFDE